MMTASAALRLVRNIFGFIVLIDDWANDAEWEKNYPTERDDSDLYCWEMYPTRQISVPR